MFKYLTNLYNWAWNEPDPAKKWARTAMLCVLSLSLSFSVDLFVISLLYLVFGR